MNARCRIFQSVLISNLAEIKDYKTTNYCFFLLKTGANPIHILILGTNLQV